MNVSCYENQIYRLWCLLFARASVVCKSLMDFFSLMMMEIGIFLYFQFKDIYTFIFYKKNKMHYSHSYGVVSLQISQFIRFREIWFYNKCVCVCNVLCVTAGHTVGIVLRLFTLCIQKERVFVQDINIGKEVIITAKVYLPEKSFQIIRC